MLATSRSKAFDCFLPVASDITDDINDVDEQRRSVKHHQNPSPDGEEIVSRNLIEPGPKEVEQR